VLFNSKIKYKEVLVDEQSKEYLMKEGVLEFGNFPVLEDAKK